MSAAITWEDPPPKVERGGGGGRHDWEGIGRSLSRRPGRWAFVARATSSGAAYNLVGQIKRKTLFGLYVHSGQFEAVSRTVDGEYRVYARYLGGTS